MRFVLAAATPPRLQFAHAPAAVAAGRSDAPIDGVDRRD
jgi:hypothetical protein